MTTLAMFEHVSTWWDELTMARQIFYGIGLLSVFVAFILAVLGFSGMEHHDAMDATDVDVDHGGGGIFSIKPLTGFFLGFGWAGGMALDAGWPLIGALATAFFAGAVMMAVIVAMFRTIVSMRSDGTVQIKDALGAIGTVYITLPPAKGAPYLGVCDYS